MGPNQYHKLLHSKANHKQNKKKTYKLEDTCKWDNQQGLNFQNIQTILKNFTESKKQTTQSKYGRKT